MLQKPIFVVVLGPSGQWTRWCTPISSSSTNMENIFLKGDPQVIGSVSDAKQNKETRCLFIRASLVVVVIVKH